MTRRRSSAPYDSLVLNDFSGGLVLSRPPVLLEPNQAQVAENVDLTDGILRRRSGWTSLGTMVSGLEGKAVTGLFGSYDDGAPKELLGVAGQKLISFVSPGWVEKGTFAFPETIYPTFTQALDKVYIALEAGGVARQMHSWDGTTLASVSGAPTARLTLFHNFAVWAAGGEGTDANRVWFSRQIPNAEVFPANNYVDLTPGDGDSVTGLAVLQGVLVALKQRSIARITGYPPDDATQTDSNMQADTYIDPHPGCIAPRSVGANNRLVVYLNAQGIYGYNGVKAEELSRPIRPVFETLNEDELERAVGRFITPNHYILSVTTSEASRPNLVISLHFTPGLHIATWRGYPTSDLGQGQTDHDLNVYSITTFTFDGQVRPVLGLVGDVGKMDDAPTDNGARIPVLYRTGVLPMGDTGGQKVIRRGWVSVAPGSGVLVLRFLPDFASAGYEVALRPPTSTATGQDAVTLRFPAVGSARRWSLEIAAEGDGPDPQVHEVAVEHFSRFRG